MAKAAKKKRRPAPRIPVARPAAVATEALAALDQAKPLAELEDTTLTPGDVAGAAEQPATPLASPDADSERRESAPAAPSTTAPASSPSSSASSAKKSAAAKPVSLTGNKYAALNRDQLRTTCAILENEVVELRAQVKRQETAAARKPLLEPEDLEEAVGETFGMIFEGLALKWGDEMELEAKQQERLGRVWALPVAKLVEKLSETNPENAALTTSLIIAAGVTGGIALKKGRQVKRRREEDARGDRAST